MQPLAVSTLPRPALKQRVFLEHANRRLDGVDRALPPFENRRARRERRLQPGARALFLFRIEAGPAASIPRRREPPVANVFRSCRGHSERVFRARQLTRRREHIIMISN